MKNPYSKAQPSIDIFHTETKTINNYSPKALFENDKLRQKSINIRLRAEKYKTIIP